MFTTKSVHDAITERSPAYAILAIDSEDRFTDFIQARKAAGAPLSDNFYNRSPYDFQITKNESMMNGFFTRLALTELNFPWTIPNINARTNEIVFKYKVGANPEASETLTLLPGFYRPSQLAAAIEAAVLAITGNPVPGFTMSYGNGGIPSFTFDSGVGTTSVAFEPLDYNSTLYPYPSTTKQLFDVLGFNDGIEVLDTSGEGGITYCQAIRYIDIICSQLTYNQALKDTMSQTVARDTLCRLYLGDGPYTGTSTMDPSDPDFCPPGCAPFTIYRQFANPKFIRWLPNQPVQGNLRFQVFDDDGNNLEEALIERTSSTAGQIVDSSENWSMTLLVSED